MEEDKIQNNIENTELPIESTVVSDTEVAETIPYPPVLLESRDKYISDKVEALYDSYGVKDLEELTSRIEGLSQAEEVDKKVSMIKVIHDKYIPAALQLDIRGSLDPSADYEEEVIWDEDVMGVGVSEFKLDWENNILVRDGNAHLHILNKSNGYKPTQIWPEEESGFVIDGFMPDLKNNIVLRDGNRALYILDSSKGYKPIKISTDAWVWNFIVNSENNIMLDGFDGGLYLLDSSKDYKPTKILSLEDMEIGISSFQLDLENNIVAFDVSQLDTLDSIMVNDAERKLYIINKTNNYNPTEIWSDLINEDKGMDFKIDLDGNILVEGDSYRNIYILDKTKNYKATKIWSGEDMGVGVNDFESDLWKNIVVSDSSSNLWVLDSSNGYQPLKVWSTENPEKIISEFILDLEGNILIMDFNYNLHILDKSKGYKPTRIAFLGIGGAIRLNSEGNILVRTNPLDGKRLIERNLSILRPKKKK